MSWHELCKSQRRRKRRKKLHKFIQNIEWWLMSLGISLELHARCMQQPTRQHMQVLSESLFFFPIKFGRRKRKLAVKKCKIIAKKYIFNNNFIIVNNYRYNKRWLNRQTENR